MPIHSLKVHWLDFRREVRSSFESFAPELPAGARQKHGWRRVWAFARAMFFRLTPPRRVVLVFAVLLLITSPFISGGIPQIVNVYRLFVAALCLLILLALELADRVALKRDLEVARDIQTWLLPHDPPSLPGLDIAFATHPANTVAGDYYDVLAGSRVLFVIADVAGKGIPAGLVMAGFRACLHTLARSASTLADLAAGLHSSCCEDSYEGRRFTTAFLAQYDPATRALLYVCAGHNPPLLRSASGAIKPLDAGGPPFGTFPGATFEVGELSVGPGDLLLMYTDGIIEAVNEAGEEYGFDRLRRFVLDVGASSAECQRQLFASINAFTGRAAQHDDITCLIVQFCG